MDELFLSKGQLMARLSPCGVSTDPALNRLVKSGLPTRYISPRKRYWIKSEVDNFLLSVLSNKKPETAKTETPASA